MNSILTLSTDLTVVQFRSMTLYTTLYTLYTAQTKSQHHKKCIGDQISQWHNVSNVHRWRNTRVKWQVTRHESHVTSLTTRDKSLTLWDTSLTTRDKSLKSWESLNSRRQKVSRHETRVSRHESRVSLYETLSILPNFCLTVSRASVRAGFPALVSCWHIIIFFYIFMSTNKFDLIWFKLFSVLRTDYVISWSTIAWNSQTIDLIQSDGLTASTGKCLKSSLASHSLTITTRDCSLDSLIINSQHYIHINADNVCVDSVHDRLPITANNRLNTFYTSAFHLATYIN